MKRAVFVWLLMAMPASGCLLLMKPTVVKGPQTGKEYRIPAGTYDLPPDLCAEIRSAYLAEHAGELHPNVATGICLGMVALGMTREEVRVALCMYEPDIADNEGLKPEYVVVNTTATTHGFHEQWVLRSIYSTRYFYFEDGILTAWQN